MATKKIHPDVFKLGLDQFKVTGKTYKIHILNGDPGDIDGSNAYNYSTTTAISDSDTDKFSLAASDAVTFNVSAISGTNGFEAVLSAALNNVGVDHTSSTPLTAKAYAIVNETDTKVLAIGNLTNQTLATGTNFDLDVVRVKLPFTEEDVS